MKTLIIVLILIVVFQTFTIIVYESEIGALLWSVDTLYLDWKAEHKLCMGVPV